MIIINKILRLLNEQVGIVNFEPYLETFLSMYSTARVMFAGLPQLPPLVTLLHRNWKEASGKDLLPVISELLYLFILAFSHAYDVILRAALYSDIYRLCYGTSHIQQL